MRSNRINSALNYISECFTAVRGRGDGMSVIQAGVGVGIQCNTIVGPAPAGVAYSTCRRAQGGETGCSLKMTNGQYEDSAISLALREKLGTTPVNQVTHFHLSSDGTWSEGVGQPSW